MIITLKQLCLDHGFSEEVVYEFIREEWISPFNGGELLFDEEDLARMELILELRHRLEVNDEGIPIILHLLDQLHALKKVLRRPA